ncbi:hypothetical protein [Luteolibacter luteus]|uniref:Uncharacterized protein n=1 Tax=Luteolibacter luteus TaxID=2728835 RepID=A0A858RNV1_9BACT|nr:hypothetical protein [Luteolibacter luteus]QJE99116.1 hypothetical protein HHL09_26165 [Luteolibacter luteus]
MKPAPLHRSLTFCSGIFVMIFIVWSWRDSMTATTYAFVSPYSVLSECGALSVCRGVPTGTQAMGRDATALAGGLVAVACPPPAFRRGSGEYGTILPQPGEPHHVWALDVMKMAPTNCWLLMIPHWLLLLAVTMVWAPALILRQRRTGRALRVSEMLPKENTATSPPTTPTAVRRRWLLRSACGRARGDRGAPSA